MAYISSERLQREKGKGRERVGIRKSRKEEICWSRSEEQVRKDEDSKDEAGADLEGDALR